MEQIKNELVFKNAATISGKLLYKMKTKDAHIFVISVKKNPKSEKSTFVRIFVTFEGALGMTYDNMFEPGDMVVVNGICQKSRNHKTARDEVRIFGLTMSGRVHGEYEISDQRFMILRGRIVKTIVISDDLLLVYLYTNIHKSIKNPNTESEQQHFEYDFVSETPVAIRRNEHDAAIVAKELTKGTWLDIAGWVNTTQTMLKSGTKITRQQLIARTIATVGTRQQSVTKTI